MKKLKNKKWLGRITGGLLGKTRSLSDGLWIRIYVQTDTSWLVVTGERQTRRPTLLETHEVESCFIYLSLPSVAALESKEMKVNRTAASIESLWKLHLLRKNSGSYFLSLIWLRWSWPWPREQADTMLTHNLIKWKNIIWMSLEISTALHRKCKVDVYRAVRWRAIPLH